MDYISKSKNAKPFLKWAGGKTQLIDVISSFYPFNQDIKKYVEPFVGGGAVLFDVLNKYELEEVYISDINAELINTYSVIRDNVSDLITLLYELQSKYIPLEVEPRRTFFFEKRDEYNSLKLNFTNDREIEKAALFIFLNRTCFNGLYRVNRKGEFNVPPGKYKNPLICDSENLIAVSDKLKNVNIICGDYKSTASNIDQNTFVYFDPPYRPLTSTSNFTSYTEGDFDDKCQTELANYISLLDEKNTLFILSNSDPKNTNEDDNFFDELYKTYNIMRVEAKRMINSKSAKRGAITELLIKNF